MPKTLEQELIERYQSLQETLIQTLGTSPLPPVEDMNAVDIATLISTYFNGYQDHRPTLRRLIDYKGLDISDEQLEEVYPAIYDFIDWLISSIEEPI